MITDRIDAVTKIPPEYMKAVLAAPKSVKIEISPRCNYRCGFCALRNREVQPKWDMDFDLFKRVTREMREAGVEEIGVFYLGESFMNPRLLVDSIRYLKSELGMPYVFLTSNASMAFPEAIEECMKAGLDSLKWSCNAADEEQFERIMGVAKKLFHAALVNVKAAWEVRKKGGYKTGLYASSIKYDGEQQQKMEELLAEKVIPYVDQHYWLPLYGRVPAGVGAGGVPGLSRKALPCWPLFTEAHITADGHLSACGLDHSPRFRMGDLNVSPFRDAWHAQCFMSLRAAHLRGETGATVCAQCVGYA